MAVSLVFPTGEYLARCIPQSEREPSAETRKDAPGGGEATPDSSLVRRAFGIGEESTGRDRPGDDALRFGADLVRFGADLELPIKGGGLVPACRPEPCRTVDGPASHSEEVGPAGHGLDGRVETVDGAVDADRKSVV